MSGRLKALFLLAWALLRVLAKRAWPARRTGLLAFEAHYVSEGLLPVTAAQREELAGFGRCIACGLCDRGEGERIAAARGAYPGVMGLMLAASRSTSERAAAAAGFAFVGDEVLAAKERLCPTGVPMRRIAASMRG